MSLFIDGSKGAGKSALVQKYEDNIFVETHDEEFAGGTRRTIKVPRGEGKTIDVEIDINEPGPTEEAIRDRYFQISLGAVVVYAVNSRESFIEVEKVIQHLYDASIYMTPPCPMILVANKCDLIGEWQVTSHEGMELAKRHGMTYVETSAKTGRNLDFVFSDLASIIDFQFNLCDSRKRKHPITLPIDKTFEGIPSYVPLTRLYPDEDFSKPPPVIRIPESTYIGDMKLLREDSDFSDLYFISSEREEKVAANKFMVYSRYSNLKSKVDALTSSIKTPFKVSTLALFLDFVYTGTLRIPTKERDAEVPLLIALSSEWHILDIQKYIAQLYPSYVSETIPHDEQSDFTLDVQQNLRRFLSVDATSQDSLFDVKFNLKDDPDGRTIYAHKSLLVHRSAYFRAMFTGGTKEKNEFEIDIFEISFPAFFAAVEYCYTDTVTWTGEDIATDLLISSNKLCLGRLKAMTASYIATEVNWDNLLKLYRLAVTADSQALTELCTFYIVRTFKKLEESHPDFKLLLKEEIEFFQERRRTWPDIEEIEKHWYADLAKDRGPNKSSCTLM
eukprot:Phypoly_transcript_06446.p1 GENE.Phypoly_transcript_06446~~Phypoly_transcript_06446.p1  ORF type:complete len:578 (+),score=51.82 Phypoly_transcript_06446:59-1735(+)